MIRLPGRSDLNTADYWDKRYSTDKNDLVVGQKISRFLSGLIQDKIRIVPKSIIDIGCGYGETIDQLRKNFGCYCSACDISPLVISENKKRYPWVDFFVSDANEYNIQRSYDIAICWHSLEHFINARDHVDRMLKKVGYYVISVPYGKNWDTCESHVNMFDEFSFLDYDVIYMDWCAELLPKEALQIDSTREVLQQGILYILKGEQNV